MAPFTEDEALAFVDAMRAQLDGKVGFKWLVGKLADLSAHISAAAAENERLNRFIDEVGLRERYEASAGTGAAPRDDVPGA